MLEEEIVCDVDDLFIVIVELIIIEEKYVINIVMIDWEWFE